MAPEPEPGSSSLSPGTTTSSPSSLVFNEAKFSVGQRAEARYRGGERYYPCNIDKQNSDGTFDLLYEEREERVGQHLIRPIVIDEEAGFGVGEEVEVAQT